jgi:ABC-type antimicrobial peptide transport system permease subunit
MFKSYLKIAGRQLLRSRLYTFINITGLAAGMAITLLIGLWIRDEISYDKYNKNYDRIAAVMEQLTFNGEVSTSYSCPVPLANELRNNYGGQFKQVVLSWWNRDHLLSFGNAKFTRTGKFMEPDATRLLSLNMLKGDRDGLKDPASILLAASAAKAIFGNADPLGKMMLIDNQLNVKVTGVYEDLPNASRFKNVMFIAPWQLFITSDAVMKDQKNNWGFDAVEIFVQLADKVDMKKASASIKNSKWNNVKNDQGLAVYKPTILLQPMSRWHLFAEWKNGINTGGSMLFVKLFGLIGLFVLLLACINFMNLSTARAEKRAKEAGIRKAIGSGRKQLVIRFFTESFLVVALAFAISILLIQLALPVFNRVADKKLSIPWSSVYFWLAAVGFSVFTGFIAGSYPAFYLSSFQPVKVLKGTFKAGRYASLPRRVLVVLQFSVSVILVIGTIIVFQQIQHAKNRPVGYSRDGLIQLQMTAPGFYEHQAALRNELLNTGAVVEVAASSSPATGIWSGRDGIDWPGKDPSMQAEFGSVAVTPEYGKTIGWQFKTGRDFSPAFATDSSALVLNEAAVQFMNLKDPVGATIKWGHGNYTVIGVIKNMLMESPYEPVRQVIYSLKNEKLEFLLIKIDPAMGVGDALNKVRNVFQKYMPASPFNYKFVDEDFAKKFVVEERVGNLAFSFTALAILISCLGLLGMASFMAEQRTKEIGIRKVLGASVLNVWQLLSGDFVLLVCISLLIASPVAYYFMHQWLQNFQYRTTISWWIFAAAGLGTLLITFMVVSFQTVKTAVTNPVESLRSE